jgi:hypothetical protein
MDLGVLVRAGENGNQHSFRNICVDWYVGIHSERYFSSSLPKPLTAGMMKMFKEEHLHQCRIFIKLG